MNLFCKLGFHKWLVGASRIDCSKKDKTKVIYIEIANVCSRCNQIRILKHRYGDGD